MMPDHQIRVGAARVVRYQLSHVATSSGQNLSLGLDEPFL